TGQHDVLLEDVPARIAGALERGHDAGDVDVAGAERDEHALAHRVGEGGLAAHDPGGQGGAHVLEVDVADPVRVRADDRTRIGAGRGQVTGVDAEADVGALDDPQGLRAALDHGAHVGVQRGLDPAAPRVVGDAVEVAEQGPPARL